MDDLHPSLFIIIYISLIFEKLLKKVLWMVGLYGSFYENSNEVCSPLCLVWSMPICDMTFQYNVVHSCVQSMLIFFSFDEQILLKCKLGILLCALVHVIVFLHGWFKFVIVLVLGVVSTPMEDIRYEVWTASNCGKVIYGLPWFLPNCEVAPFFWSSQCVIYCSIFFGMGTLWQK